MAPVAVVRPVLIGLATLVVWSCWAAVVTTVTPPSAGGRAGPGPDRGPSPTAVAQVTVRIDAEGCGWHTIGSGAVIGDDLVATNRHVVAGTAEVEVAGSSPSGPWWSSATVVGAATDQDLVLLRLATPAPTSPATLAPTGFRAREPVAFGGFPDGWRLSVRAATASSRWSTPAPSSAGPVWVLSRTGAAGMSGGPVLNGDGELAGIVFAVERRSRTTLALGSDVVADLVASTGSSTDPVVIGC